MTAPSLLAKQLRAIGKSVLRTSSSPASRVPRRQRFSRVSVIVTIALCATPLVAGGTFFLVTPTEDILSVATPQKIVRTHVRLPDLRGQMASIEANTEVVLHDSFIQPAETLLSLFSRLGIRDPQALVFIRRNALALPLVYPKAGQFVTADVHEDGSLQTLRLYTDGDRPGANRLIEVTRKGTDLQCTDSLYQYDVQLSMASGTVQGTPDTSLRDSRVPSSILSQMHNAFEYDRDVVSRLKTGDAFRVIYESKYAEGSFVRYGRVLAMQFDHDGKTTELFWYNDGRPGGNYYDAKGRISRRTFMRVPLDVTSVSSEFAPLRRHPVTGVVRPHQGTDFRAPWGATVRAAADGKVTFAGNGTGYGKYIKIQHGPDVLTLYAHLSHISTDLRIGTEVKHGQVIGRVGQTGLATGPHLHYELKVNGVQVNPMTVHFPDREVLSPYQYAQLEVHIAPLRSKLGLLERVQVSQIKHSELTKTGDETTATR